jgi:Arc/MetJ-type ribon-helix-helix transcriptional regulator
VRTSTDKSLQSTLTWALERMREKGFVVKSTVSLSIDPKLAIMGYAKKEGHAHRIVISDWALDSEMLGGLVLHELAHVYFTERGAFSHDSEVLERLLQEMREKDGIRAKEVEHLIDAYNHLQNILVDDVVFAVMQGKEVDMAKRFFSEWVSDSPSGDPVLDASLLCRNAFAIASLKRRRLLERGNDMNYRNMGFVSSLGGSEEKEFDWIEGFLENARPDCNEREFGDAMGVYMDRILSLMRPGSKLTDLR